MTDPTDTRAILKSWLRNRLTEGERPKQEWRELLEASWDYLLSTKVRDLVDADTAKDLADRLADPELVTELSRPIVAEVARVVIAEVRNDEEPLERFLPTEAQEQLQAALTRPGLIHPDWIRNIFRGEAAEAVLNDVLYRALRDFSTLLPRLMVKIFPMGRLGVIGGAGAFMEKLIEELEKMMEPEIKSFLADSTERVLERAAEFTIAIIDEPVSMEFRRNLATFILSNSPAFYLEAADDELIADVGSVVELTARHVTQMPEVRAGTHAWIDRAMRHAEDKTVGELLQIEGTEARPPMDALAEATWPAFKAMLGSPQVQRWMDDLLDELLDEHERVDITRGQRS